MRCEACDQDGSVTVTERVDGEWRKVGYCEEHRPILTGTPDFPRSISWPEEAIHRELWVKQSRIDNNETVKLDIPDLPFVRFQLEPKMAGGELRFCREDEETGEQRAYLVLRVRVGDGAA